MLPLNSLLTTCISPTDIPTNSTMPSKLSLTLHFSLLLSLSTVSLLAYPAPAPAPTPTPQTPYSACQATQYPKLCRRVLRGMPRSNPHSFGQVSVLQSFQQAKNITQLLARHVAAAMPYMRLSSAANPGVLDDCLELSESTVEDLEAVAEELHDASAGSMSDEVAGRVQTLLSAVVTNQQTCSDGLVESKSRVTSALARPLRNATQLYSVSLSLVTNALDSTEDGRRRKRTTSYESFAAPSWAQEPISALSEVMETMSSSGERNLTELMAGIKVRDSVSVSVAGALPANFTTIGAAVGSAPNKTDVVDGYFVIYVREGVYWENVVIPKYKRYIMMIGDGINRTVITANRSVVDGWTTYNSATFAVAGEGFVAMDITFRNTAGPQKHQAVAVKSTADLSVFFRCSFEAYQDTLYLHSKRQFLRNCDIFGTVDFIFGNSASILQNCYLLARKPLPDQKNSITAQGRTISSQNTGISIHNCTIRPAPDLASDPNSTSTYLGRPWKQFAQTVVMQSYIDGFLEPAGWLEWNGTQGLDTIYYGEFENSGPGSNTSKRVGWSGFYRMNESEALRFTVYNFTLGDTWLTTVNVPFYVGLL